MGVFVGYGIGVRRLLYIVLHVTAREHARVRFKAEKGASDDLDGHVCQDMQLSRAEQCNMRCEGYTCREVYKGFRTADCGSCGRHGIQSINDIPNTSNRQHGGRHGLYRDVG